MSADIVWSAVAALMGALGGWIAAEGFVALCKLLWKRLRKALRCCTA